VLALTLPLVLVLAAAGAHHLWVVQPHRKAEISLAASQALLGPVLARTKLPMLALPGTGGPVAGDPSVVALPIAANDRVTLEQTETELDALWSEVPRSPAVAGQLGLVRLVLGRDRDARRAWESALVYGDQAQQRAARVGLGLIALRVGLRQSDEQDRLFALEHALAHLDRLGDASSPELSFNRGVLLAALDRPDEARVMLSALQTDPSVLPMSELLAAWVETPILSGATAPKAPSLSPESLPGSSSLPTIDMGVDPSTEVDSIGSPE